MHTFNSNGLMLRSSNHSHKDSASMGSRDGVEEQDTVLVRGFYKAETKTTPRFWDGIDVSGSRNGTLDPESCDYMVRTNSSIRTLRSKQI